MNYISLILLVIMYIFDFIDIFKNKGPSADGPSFIHIKVGLLPVGSDHGIELAVIIRRERGLPRRRRRQA